jgi:hypothetical protein
LFVTSSRQEIAEYFLKSSYLSRVKGMLSR